MKIIRNSFLMIIALLGIYSFTPNAKTFLNYPDKTIVIKNPMAGDVNKFFSNNTIIQFEIYKLGNADDLKTFINTVLSDKAVFNCTSDHVAGDFTGIVLSLKTNKNKAWFVSLFKKAGLNNIKINQSDVVTLDKL